MVAQLRRQTNYNLRSVNGRCYRHHTMLKGVGRNTRRRRVDWVERNVPGVVEEVEDVDEEVEDVDEEVEDVDEEVIPETERIPDEFLHLPAATAVDQFATLEEIKTFFEGYFKIKPIIFRPTIPTNIVNSYRRCVINTDIDQNNITRNEMDKLADMCNFFFIWYSDLIIANNIIFGKHVSALDAPHEYPMIRDTIVTRELKNIIEINKSMQAERERTRETQLVVCKARFELFQKETTFSFA